MTNAQNNFFLSALRWHIDIGADEAWGDAPIDCTAFVMPTAIISSPPRVEPVAVVDIAGTKELVAEAQKRAAACQTLDELKAAITAFDGISIKKTAANMVFADGNPKAYVMVIGDAPEADEDRQGIPFVGASGQLLDKILACIGLTRTSENPENAAYMTNILNWRPPGNRTPSDEEIALSLPFIRRHIELATPKMIILCGSVPAKALLERGESLSRLRGSFHDVLGIPAIATYHPAYLLKTPSQKRAVWNDMLMLQAKMREMKN